MRAGLLSNPQVIEYINRNFVATWVVEEELHPEAEKFDGLARVLARQHEYPMDLVFLTKGGKMLSKLTSFKDLGAAHCDVAHPRRGGAPHFDVFMGAARKYVGE